MDLQAAKRVVGFWGRLARIAALMCFILASGILIVTHTGPTRASIDRAEIGQRSLSFAAR